MKMDKIKIIRHSYFLNVLFVKKLYARKCLELFVNIDDLIKYCSENNLLVTNIKKFQNPKKNDN